MSKKRHVGAASDPYRSARSGRKTSPESGRDGFIRDLRFGPIFFLVSPWRAGDVTPSPPCCPLVSRWTARFRGASTLIWPLPRAGRPPWRHSRRCRPGSLP